VNQNFSEQYETACVVITDPELCQMVLREGAADDVIQYAKNIGALYDDEPGSTCYVIQFPNRPQELYTESALRRSFK
jgi:hypothetical protein